MAFLNSNDILVLQKNKGTVQRIINGTIQSKPLLDADVPNKGERGMLGMPAVQSLKADIRMFSFILLKPRKKEVMIVLSLIIVFQETHHLGIVFTDTNYQTIQLVNPILLMDLPALPGPAHNGGKVVIGPDKNVYFTIGDLVAHKTRDTETIRGKRILTQQVQYIGLLKTVVLYPMVL